MMGVYLFFCIYLIVSLSVCGGGGCCSVYVLLLLVVECCAVIGLVGSGSTVFILRAG